MRRVAAFVLAITIFCASMPTAFAVGTSAASAILMDADSGRVLYEKDADTRRAIASITKLMTALVALETDDDLDRVVTVKAEYTGIEGSSMYLRAGEELTVRELLYGLLLHSGNDAAVAIACVTAGSVDAFVERMNQTAAELGMTNTHFMNPHGLSMDGHYSTARDMARLTAECLKNEQLVAITATKSITIGSRTMTNHNKLLWRYEGCIGMKTGYTTLAGRTLISCAQRDGQSLIVVTLCDSKDWEDHKALLDYGFKEYPGRELVQQGTVVAALPVSFSLIRFIPVTAAQTIVYPVGAEEKITAEYDIPDGLEAPLKAGQNVGHVTFYLDGREIGRSDLVCAAAVERNSMGTITEKGILSRLFGR